MTTENITLTKQELAEMLEKAVENGVSKNVSKVENTIGSKMAAIAVFLILFGIGAAINIFTGNFNLGFSTIAFSILVFVFMV